MVPPTVASRQPQYSVAPKQSQGGSRAFTYVIVGLFLVGGVIAIATGLGGYLYYRSLKNERTEIRPTPSPSPYVVVDPPFVAKRDTPSPAPTSRWPTPTPDSKKTPVVDTDVGDGPDDSPPAVNTESKRPVPKQISGGVLNGKATFLPKPPYPPAARAVQAAGAVSVQVLIDESGNVVSASAVSGHPLLRAAAVQAARGARFEPTKLAGQPVKVSGVITYNFVP